MQQNKEFSANQRNKWLGDLAHKEYDLIVIGGGITGAGILLDAASRGLKTLLVEKSDFGFGTSSRSTKLIHGGLRYLKQFDFKLVRNVGKERKIAYQNASYLIHPEKMLLPIIEKGSLSKTGASIGLWLYEFLAGVGAKDRRRMLNTSETLKQEPLLEKQIIKGGALYSEYRTDDARLVIEIIKTALDFGAEAINYAPVTEIQYDADAKIKGLKIEEKFSGKIYEIKAKYVVNASGPWVDDIRGLDSSISKKQLKLSKGVHIVFPFYKLPISQSIYFDTPDGRMIFAIPRNGCTYVGTTDTFYEGNKEDVYANLSDVNYLLNAIQNVFPNQKLGVADVVSSWAGLRPLIYEEGKSATELSRKDEVFISNSGLVSIAGGKLTGYRLMAKKVVDLLMKKHFTKSEVLIPKCYTHKIKLVGYLDISLETLQDYIERQTGEAKQVLANYELVNRWVHSYGKATEKIIEIAYDIWPKINLKEKHLTCFYAEIIYVTSFEMVILPDDYWIRRSGTLYFNAENLPKLMKDLEGFLLDALHIDDQDVIKDLNIRMKDIIKKTTQFK